MITDTQWKYQIGGRPKGLIAEIILLILFGAATLSLFRHRNGAFLFSLILTVIVIVLIILTIWRAARFKLLLGEESFCHKMGRAGKKYYNYSDILDAWTSTGQNLNGTTGCWCVYKTKNGQTIRFSFLPSESEQIDYFLEQIHTHSCNTEQEQIDESSKEYTIDGKVSGIAPIVTSVILLAAFVLMAIFVRFDIMTTIFFCFGAVLSLYILIRIIVRYCFFQIKIGTGGFWIRTGPSSQQYFPYTDIRSCREEEKISRQHKAVGNMKNLYYYYFIFTDKSGLTIRFQFQKPIHGHEIDILQQRIRNAGGMRR